MNFIDYFISLIVFCFFVIGLFRGFYNELISSVFWCFNFYFFSYYNYFLSFYSDSLKNIFIVNKILMFILFVFFYCLKKLLSYFLKTIILKTNFLFFNVLLGGLLGLFRAIVLIYLLLMIILYLYHEKFIYYLNQSIFAPFILNEKLFHIFFCVIESLFQ